MLAASVALAVHLAAAPAGAMTLLVTENQIVSLANSPALLALEPMMDEAGRPSLRLELEFANDCYAGVGVDTRLLAKPTGAGAVIVVSQRVPPDGCPEIFQPVRRTLGLRLPYALARQSLYVVARPGPEGGVRSVRLAGAPSRRLEADEIRDLSLFAMSVPMIRSVSTEPSGATGYLLLGTLQAAAGCAASDLQIRVFEVPDDEGAPRGDAVLITAPAECVSPVNGELEEIEVSAHIDTPQGRSGRTVTLLNAVPPEAMPLP